MKQNNYSKQVKIMSADHLLESKKTDIRILMITVRADYGGGPQHVNLLLNNLPDVFSIFVACPNDKPYYEYWKENRRVQSIALLPHRGFAVSSFLSLVRFVKTHEIDIIHSHGKGGGLYSRLLKLLLPNLKIVHTFHGMHYENHGLFYRSLYFAYEKVCDLLTDRYINVSYGEYNICAANRLTSEEKSTVIYNGIEKFPVMNRMRAKLGLPEDRFIVATLTRFDYQKNMEFALEIAKAMSRYDKLLFLWIGDGDDRNSLELRAQREDIDNVLFVGFRRNIVEYLNASDLYLSTARWEGLPISLIEAQSLGIPVVATNVVGNNEVVADAENGFLFYDGDIDTACNCILRLFNDRSLYEEMATASRKIFAKKFTIEQMADKTVTLYNSLLN